jgi:hypothetical protein
VSIGAPVELTSNISNSTLASRTTASFTPTAGSIVIACCAVREATGGAPAPDITISNTHAGSWSWDRITISDAAANRHTLAAFVAEAPSAPGAGTVTFSLSENVNRTEHAIFEVGAALSSIAGTITGTGTTATPSVTLTSSPAADSVIIGVLASVAHTATITPGAGFTTLLQTPSTSLTALHIEYDLTPTGTTVDWSGAGTTSNLAIAFEIPAAAVGLPPSMLVRRRR